ncbi:MAG: hypothetical protein BRD57_05080, partial [Proteobacteria bacterium SW_6_67_9]
MNRPIGALAAFALWLLAGAAGATNVPAAPSVSPQTHVLMEAASGQVLAADSHYASARDIAILARAIIQRFPERYQRYA